MPVAGKTKSPIDLVVLENVPGIVVVEDRERMA
jgi:hypothetical protein